MEFIFSCFATFSAGRVSNIYQSRGMFGWHTFVYSSLRAIGLAFAREEAPTMSTSLHISRARDAVLCVLGWKAALPGLVPRIHGMRRSTMPWRTGTRSSGQSSGSHLLASAWIVTSRSVLRSFRDGTAIFFVTSTKFRSASTWCAQVVQCRCSPRGFFLTGDKPFRRRIARLQSASSPVWIARGTRSAEATSLLRHQLRSPLLETGVGAWRYRRNLPAPAFPMWVSVRCQRCVCAYSASLLVTGASCTRLWAAIR